MIATEQLKFTVHENIIHDLVYSQNGTVATAIRELVMNALDAGSPSCKIAMTTKHFTVTDSGKGFANEDEVKNYFKTFGFPHDPENKAVFGRFRIGRGQIMAFGKVSWISNKFSMTVDIRNNGFSFEFQKYDTVQYAGCKVTGTFYEELNKYSLVGVEQEIEELICYSDKEIKFNGKPLTIPKENIPWDVVGDDFFISWKRFGGTKIYSNGIFVKEISPYFFGFGATIVTTKALNLNMARNEISENDPLWKKIKEHLDAYAAKKAKLRGRDGHISETERKGMVQSFLSGRLYDDDVPYVCLFKTVRGKSVSIATILGKKIPLTICPHGSSNIAEAIEMRGFAIVLEENTLEEFKVKTLEEFIDKICYVLRNYENPCPHLAERLEKKELCSFLKFSKHLIDEKSLLPMKKHTSRQRAAKNALQHGSVLLARELGKYFDRPVGQRKIFLGQSLTSLAWTNGVDSIVVEENVLNCMDRLGRSAGPQMALLLLHEYLHSNDNISSHSHDLSFMESFHNIASDFERDILGTVGTGIYNKYLKELVIKKLPLPKKIESRKDRSIAQEFKHYELTFIENKITPFFKEVMQLFKIPFKISKGKVLISLHVYTHYGVVNGDTKKSKKFEKIPSKFHTLDHLLLHLCEVQESGLLYVVCNNPSMENTKKVFSKDIEYHHNILRGFPGSGKWYYPLEDVSLQTSKYYTIANKTGRIEYAKAIVEHAISGLKNPLEKKELLSALADRAKEG